jgi:hypothetical protein
MDLPDDKGTYVLNASVPQMKQVEVWDSIAGLVEQARQFRIPIPRFGSQAFTWPSSYTGGPPQFDLNRLGLGQ